MGVVLFRGVHGPTRPRKLHIHPHPSPQTSHPTPPVPSLILIHTHPTPPKVRSILIHPRRIFVTKPKAVIIEVASPSDHFSYLLALRNYFVQRESREQDTSLRSCGKAVGRLELDAHSQTKDKACMSCATIFQQETTLDSTRRTSFRPDKRKLTAK